MIRRAIYGAPMSGDSVFVIDGDPAVRDSLSTLLELNGFEVETHATGAAFLRHFNDETTTVCVVCEADLPDTSGIRIFEKLNTASTGPPFVLLVSRRNPSIIKLAREAGIEQIFLKPLVHRHLIEFINRKPR